MNISADKLSKMEKPTYTKIVNRNGIHQGTVYIIHTLRLDRIAGDDYSQLTHIKLVENSDFVASRSGGVIKSRHMLHQAFEWALSDTHTIVSFWVHNVNHLFAIPKGVKLTFSFDDLFNTDREIDLGDTGIILWRVRYNELLSSIGASAMDVFDCLVDKESTDGK